MTKQVQDEITDLNGVIRGLENAIQVTETTMQNDRLFEESIAAHRERIAFHQRKLEEEIHRREHGAEIIAGYREQIVDLRRRVKRLQHTREVDQLRRLEAEIAALIASDERCQVVLQYGDKHRRCDGAVATSVRFHGKIVLACEECRQAYETSGDEFYIRSQP